jgi:hypothetical protein
MSDKLKAVWEWMKEPGWLGVAKGVWVVGGVVVVLTFGSCN